MTGFNYLSAELAAKRLELLLELMPGTKNLAVLVDPAVPPTQTTLREVTAAASIMGLRIKTLNASNSSEINAAFVTLARERPDVLFVGRSATDSCRMLSFPSEARRRTRQ